MKTSKDDSRNQTSKLLSYVVETLEKNNEFLLKNAKIAYDEIIELINDSIDYAIFFTENKSGTDDYVKFAMINFVHHILMPMSYAIYTDLLASNLVACFIELRLMLESMVKCYYADLKYPNETFFQVKIDRLEMELKSQKKSISKLLREFEKEAVSLWRNISNNWVHTKGYTRNLVNEITKKLDVPAWALAIPMIFTATDLDVITELQKSTAQFRELLRTAIESWKKQVQS